MSAELPRWAMGDPARIVERLEQAEQRQHARSMQEKAQRARFGIEQLFAGDAMTQDESEKIEQLLDTWYDYERNYRPALGAPRVSVSCRSHDAGEVFDTLADRDEKLERLTAEDVGACVDELHYLQRAAIEVHMRNKRSRPVHRNPRIEDQHAAYQEAKDALRPRLARRGLL